MLITKETANFEEKIGEILKKGNIFKLEYCGKDNTDLYGVQYSIEVVGDDIEEIDSFEVTALNEKAEEELTLVSDNINITELIIAVQYGAVITIGEDKVKEM